MNLNLTEKQAEIFEFLKSEIETTGSSPSIRKICKQVGLSSTSTVHNHLVNLEKKGYIRKDPTNTRSISIVKKRINSIPAFVDSIVSLPVLSNFCSRKDIFDSENISDNILVPKVMTNGNSCFIYIKNGDNMRNYAILHKDYVIIDTDKAVNDGDLALVLLYDDVVDVRQYYNTENGISLKSTNNIVLNSSLVKVIGVVTGVFRYKI